MTRPEASARDHAPIRIALIGVGRMGRVHAEAIARQVPNMEALVVADRDRGRAREGARQLGATAFIIDERSSLNDMLDRWRVDACVIATPTATHVQIARVAIERGVHVLCEKPISFDVDETLELGQLATDRGVVLGVGFYRRFSPAYQRAHELLCSASGARPVLFRLSQWDAAIPSAAFLRTSGGLALDCGIHELDALEWLSGAEVVRVRAQPLRVVSPVARSAGDYDNLLIEAHLDDGSVAIIDLSRNCGYADDVRTEVLLEGGAMVIETWPTARLLIGDAQGRRELRFDAPHQSAIAAELRAFAAAVRGEDVDLPGARESARATGLALAATAAAADGSELELSR